MAAKKNAPFFSKTTFFLILITLLIGVIAGNYIELQKTFMQYSIPTDERQYQGESISLPEPDTTGTLSVEAAMQNRRSRRAYTDAPLTIKQLSQLLWAMQGQTADWGGRTVPSAKNAYPLNITVVAKNVTDVDPAVYHYLPDTHSIRKIMNSIPENFDEAAVQGQNKSAPVAFIISGDYAKMSKAFDGESHDENVVLEAGHVGQNAYLQVESLGLGTVVSGGFNKALMQEVLQIPRQEDIFYLIPVGVPAVEPENEK